MSFDYHTGYIPGVMQEEIHKRRKRHRAYLGLLIIGLVLFWIINISQDESQDIAQNSLQSLPKGVVITSSSEVESSSSGGSLDSLKTMETIKPYSQMAHETMRPRNVSVAPVVSTGKVDKLENNPDLEKSYEKNIELIINKAFSSN